MNKPKKVTGIGGIFFKCKNPELTSDWYRHHLGLQTDAYGTSFAWRKADKPEEKAYSAWSPFPSNTTYFGESGQEFMINLRVENLEALLKELNKEGVKVLGEIQEFEYGKFAHILDPDGRKLELWEANDEEYEKMLNNGNLT